MFTYIPNFLIENMINIISSEKSKEIMWSNCWGQEDANFILFGIPVDFGEDENGHIFSIPDQNYWHSESFRENRAFATIFFRF